jgi:hypothetical protein
MKTYIAKQLCQTAQRMGIEGVEYRPDYSGRGMFGKTTDAILIPRQTVLLQLLMQVAIDKAYGNVQLSLDEELSTEVDKFRTDNINNDILVY